MTSNNRRTTPIALSLAALLLTGASVGCDKPDAETASADAPQAQAEPGSDEAKVEGHDDHPEHVEDEHHDVHLGNKMYELQRRWSAIWFAGQAGDAEMVKYQTHEIEELVEAMEAADPQEAGVDVVDRLNMHVIDKLEAIEEAAAQKDQALFEKRYNAITNGCNACHAETKHAFIEVQKPEYNPYPNLRFGGQ